MSIPLNKELLKVLQHALCSSFFVVTKKPSTTPMLITKCAYAIKIILETFPTLHDKIVLNKSTYERLFDSRTPLVFDLYAMKFERLAVNKFTVYYGKTIKTKSELSELLKYLSERPQVKKVN